MIYYVTLNNHDVDIKTQLCEAKALAWRIRDAGEVRIQAYTSKVAGDGGFLKYVLKLNDKLNFIKVKG